MEGPTGRRDPLKRLRAFCHAARLGSITGAAAYLGTSQPAVSVHVRTLEARLGVALFARHGSRIVLTPAGERLYAEAMGLVAGMDRLPEAFAEYHHGATGDALTLAAGQTAAAYLLPEYVERFRARWPDVAVHIRTAPGERALGWLRAHEVDLVVASVDVAPRDVAFHPVRTSRFVLVTPPGHPLAGRAAVGLEEAAAYPFVGHGAERYVARLIETLLRLHGVALEVVAEVDGWGVITNYVAAGVGCAFVPELCLRENDGLWRIPAPVPVPARRYGAMTRARGALALHARRFLAVMAPGAGR